MFTTWLVLLSCVATGISSQCPPGWVYKFNSCYGYGANSATWGSAQATCRAYEAKLVEIETSQENVFVKELIRSRGIYPVWIGGIASFRGGTYEWATTQKLLYPFTDMAPSEPNRALRIHSSLVTFAVQGIRDVSTVVKLAKKKNASADDGLLATEMQSIKKIVASCRKSKTTCRAYGAKLVEIETSEENVFVKELIRSRGIYPVWIGGIASFRGGTFEWATTQKLLYPFTDMAPSEPNRDGNCLVMWTGLSCVRWGDNPCPNLCDFVCERQI